MDKGSLGAFIGSFSSGLAKGQEMKARREEMELNKKLLDAKIKAMNLEAEMKTKALTQIMAEWGGGAAQPPQRGSAGPSFPDAASEVMFGSPQPPMAPGGGQPSGMPSAPGGTAGGQDRLNNLASTVAGQILFHQGLGFVPTPEEAMMREVAGEGGKPMLQAFTKGGLPMKGRAYPLPEKPETAQQKFIQSAKLRGEFTDATKIYRDVRDSFARVQESAVDPSAAGDLALIFNYMKMLDPGSTVREGEFANAENSGGVPEIIRAQYNKLMSGERLSDKMRNDFLNRAEMLYGRQSDQYEKNKSEFTRLANELKINPKEVIIDFGLAARKKKGQPSLKMPGKKAKTASPEEEAAAYMSGR